MNGLRKCPECENPLTTGAVECSRCNTVLPLEWLTPASASDHQTVRARFPHIRFCDFVLNDIKCPMPVTVGGHRSLGWCGYHMLPHLRTHDEAKARELDWICANTRAAILEDKSDRFDKLLQALQSQQPPSEELRAQFDALRGSAPRGSRQVFDRAKIQREAAEKRRRDASISAENVDDLIESVETQVEEMLKRGVTPSLAIGVALETEIKARIGDWR